MSTIRHFISEALRNLKIDEFLLKELERAGYGGAEITSTPLGTRVIISAMKPGMVIGRRGTNIRNLSKILEEKFGMMNPQIAVSDIEVPELNPRIMASRIVDALQRGIHFRRAGYWALNRIMSAGALGAEIVISGKLRTRRHRYEKYRAGYIPITGEVALKNVKRAVSHAKLRPGILGVKVKIVPTEAELSDRFKTLFAIGEGIKFNEPEKEETPVKSQSEVKED